MLRVSLITVCYNAAKTIGATLESVRRQRNVAIEYHIVDGASTDGTQDVIRAAVPALEAAGVTVRYTSEPDRGLYDAINKGVARATGDLVGILNADDVFDSEDVLAEVVTAFADGSLEAVYGDVRFVRGSSEKTIRYYSSRHWKPWMHNWGYMPAHPTVYVRRSVFDRFGAYRSDYAISADFEWMVRVFCRGRVVRRYLPRCLVRMRLGGKSTAGLGAMLQLNRENVRANRANGYFSILPMMLPKYFYKILGYFRTIRELRAVRS